MKTQTLLIYFFFSLLDSFSCEASTRSLKIEDDGFVKLNLTPKNIGSKEVQRLFENSILDKLKVITIYENYAK